MCFRFKYFLFAALVFSCRPARAQLIYCGYADSIAVAKVAEIPVVKLLLSNDSYKYRHYRSNHRLHIFVKGYEHYQRNYEPMYRVDVIDSSGYKKEVLYIFYVDSRSDSICYCDPKTFRKMTLAEWEARNKKK